MNHIFRILLFILSISVIAFTLANDNTQVPDALQKYTGTWQGQWKSQVKEKSQGKEQGKNGGNNEKEPLEKITWTVTRNNDYSFKRQISYCKAGQCKELSQQGTWSVYRSYLNYQIIDDQTKKTEFYEIASNNDCLNLISQTFMDFEHIELKECLN